MPQKLGLTSGSLGFDHRGKKVDIAYYVRGNGTIASGVVVIETSSVDDYSGTWSVLQSITMSTLSGDKEQSVHIQGTLGASRARISTPIGGGGSVDLTLFLGT